MGRSGAPRADSGFGLLLLVVRGGEAPVEDLERILGKDRHHDLLAGLGPALDDLTVLLLGVAQNTDHAAANNEQQQAKA